MKTTSKNTFRPAWAALLAATLAACGGTGEPGDGTPGPDGCVLLSDTRIDTAVTLGQPCYRVDTTLYVENGGALTVNAGTTLRFAAGTDLYVQQGGSLAALGTADKPVTFTGQDKTPGFWGGVRFVFSNSSQNTLNHTVVEYGGGNTEQANLAATGLSTSLARLKLNAVTLRHGSHAGFVFDDQTQLDAFDGLTVTGNAFPGRLPANLVGRLGTSSRFGGNAENAIRVDSGAVTQAQTWQRQDVPYRLLDTGALYRAEAPLTIAPGVTLRMAAGASMYVAQTGSLKAAGTAALPITFTGEQPTAGYWEGIEFVFSNDIANELSHAVVEYAGGSVRGAAISLLSLSSSPSRVKLSDLVVRHSSSAGFGFDDLALVDQFTAVTSTSNAYAGYVGANGVSVLGGDSRYQGNTQDHVRIDSRGGVTRSQTWHALDVPFLLPDGGNYLVETALTLEAGTRMLMGSGSTLYVDQAGSLTAVGTAAAPITLHGAQATPGYWEGIQFVFSNNTANVLDHVEVRHAGAGTPASSGAITLQSLTSSPARLALTNSLIADSASWGVFRDALSMFTQSGNTYTNNVSGSVNR